MISGKLFPPLVGQEYVAQGFFRKNRPFRWGTHSIYDEGDSKAPVKSNVRCCGNGIVAVVMFVEACRAVREVGGHCRSQRQAQVVGGSGSR
jgi:hypothetical protein